MAMVANDGTRMTIASAATTPAAAMIVSVCAARNALTSDGSPSLAFGVRRNALWNRINPRMQARVTTQLNANHTCSPAMASRHVHPVFSFIAQTARSSPEARNAMGRPRASPVMLRIGSWWCIAVDAAVASRRSVKHVIRTSPNHCTLPRK